jgi:hypothetical protein
MLRSNGKVRFQGASSVFGYLGTVNGAGERGGGWGTMEHQDC